MSMNRIAAGLSALAVLAAQAMSEAGTLATDPNAYYDGINTWHGTTAYQGYDAFNSPSGLMGTIDWAVYDSNNAPAGFAGYVRTPDEFIYTYQAHQTGSAPLSSVSVLLENVSDNIGTFTATGIAGAAPYDAQLLAFDSATWSFLGIFAGDSSIGLVFSSSHVPMLSSATVIDDGTVGALAVPSPQVPEPSTLILSVVAMAFISLRWLGLSRSRPRSAVVDLTAARF